MSVVVHHRARILLVRHGHYERVGDLGDRVWELSPLGRRQAVHTGRRLLHLLDTDSTEFGGLFASPWPRARQTAEIASKEIKVERITIKPYLHESLPLVDPERSAKWGIHPDLPMTSEDDRKATQKQVNRVREQFFRPPKHDTTLVLFTHGNLIRYLVNSVLDLPLEAWCRLSIAHASITEIHTYDDGFETLISFNGTNHLPASMVTSA